MLCVGDKYKILPSNSSSSIQLEIVSVFIKHPEQKKTVADIVDKFIISLKTKKNGDYFLIRNFLTHFFEFF